MKKKYFTPFRIIVFGFTGIDGVVLPVGEALSDGSPLLGVHGDNTGGCHRSSFLKCKVRHIIIDVECNVNHGAAA